MRVRWASPPAADSSYRIARFLPDVRPFPPMVERSHHPTLAPSPRRSSASTFRRSTVPPDGRALPPPMLDRSPPMVERFHLPTLVLSPRWSRCEPRAASLETACAGAGSVRRVMRIPVGERGLEASSLALLGTSTIGTDLPMLDRSFPRWSRCEPRAASLETRRDDKHRNHIHYPLDVIERPVDEIPRPVDE